MSDIVPTGGSPFRKFNKANWKHPDPRLAGFAYNCTVAGITKSDLAKITGVSTKTLDEHYGPELEGARVHAVARLTELALDMAEQGNEKVLIYLMKSIGGINEKMKARELEEAKSKPAENATGLDTSKLNKEQLRNLHYYMSIMQTTDPDPIEGEVLSIEEDEE